MATTPSVEQTTERRTITCPKHGLPVALTVITRHGLTWEFVDEHCPTCKKERAEWMRGYNQRQRERYPENHRVIVAKPRVKVSAPRTGSDPER